MNASHVIVRDGTTTARVRPENVESYRLQLERASKVPTTKQANARALTGGVVRSYPRFTDGMSTAEYVAEYYARNQPPFGGTDRYLNGDPAQYRKVAETNHRKEKPRKFAAAVVADFFEPLSTAPQYAQTGEVLEETI